MFFPEIKDVKRMIQLLLCGASGKMGRVIASLAEQREDMEIVAGIDIQTQAYSSFPIYPSFEEFEGKADVIVDFSHPALLPSLLDYAKRTKTPLIAATTGYSEEQTEQIRAAAKEIAVFFTFNMSIGINLMLDLARKAAAVLGEGFDIEIVEKHHNQKIDAPSGTALMLVNAINEASGDRYYYEYDRHSKRQKRNKKEIGIHAVRGGTIVGEHEVLFAGRDEILTISHSARSKEIFANGALAAAAYLAGKGPGLYDMGNLVEEK